MNKLFERKNFPKLLKFSIISILFFSGLVSLGAWAFASPVGSSPDDAYHLGSMYCQSGENKYCQLPDDIEEWKGPDGKYGWQRPAMIPSGIVDSQCIQNDWQLGITSGSCQPDMSKTDKLKLGGIDNGNYPPGYYWFMNHFISGNLTLFNIIVRAINSILFMSLLVSALLITNSKLSRALTLTIALSIVPVGFFMLASVNPSSWAIIGLTFFWVFQLEASSDNPKLNRLWSISFAFICLLIASLSRNDAALYVFVSCIAILIVYSSQGFFKSPSRYIPLVISTVSSGVLFASYRQINSITGGKLEFVESGLTLLIQNTLELPMYLAGNFGYPGPEEWPLGLGSMSLDLPAIVPVTGLLCIGGVTIPRLFPLHKWRYSLSQILIFSAMVAVPLLILQARGTVGIRALQPRYLLPIIIVLIGFVILGSSKRMSLRSLLVISTLISITNAISLNYTIRRYISGQETTDFNLNNNVEWWWEGLGIGPAKMWVIGSIAATIFIFSLAAIYNNKFSIINDSMLLKESKSSH